MMRALARPAIRPSLLCVAVAAFLSFAAGSARAWDPLQKARRAAASGQRALAEGDTLTAVDDFLRAQALAPDDPQIRMGLGEAFYGSGEYRSSRAQFEALKEAPEEERRQQALYNAGNAAFEMEEYQAALDLYTRAVAEAGEQSSPDLLYNLELTQKLLEQSQQEDPSQDGEGEDSQEQEPSEDQDSEPQDQQQQDQQPQEDQQQDPQEQPPEEGEQSPPDEQESSAQQPPEDQEQPNPQPNEQELAGAMTPEEAIRLLDALDHDEEELRKSIQRRLRGDETESEHDW